MNKILLSSAAIAVLLLSGCTEDKKTTTQVTAEVAPKQEVAKEVTQAVTESNKAVENSVQEIKDTATSNVVQKVEEVKTESKEVSNVQNEVKEVAKTEETQTPVVIEEKASEASTQEVAKVEEGANGEVLFKACASCHGLKGEKEALGKSQIIAGWEKEKIINAIKGYQAGTYGGVMKNIMKGQVGSKTDVEIDALATFISNL